MNLSLIRFIILIINNTQSLIPNQYNQYNYFN